jgi:uncharacterized SAM-binding protein YcdF (DUF218 family)
MLFVRTTIIALCLLTVLITLPLAAHYIRGNLTYTSLSAEEKTDAVMVFSGSPNRLIEGYKIYEQGQSKKLMITGNDYFINAKDKQVKKLVRKLKNQKDKVFIDLTADNTIENAMMGADWALKNNVKSILLITTQAHMARSFFELRRLLPDDVEIFTHAVPGEYEVAGFDSEQTRLLCRMYETAIDTDFCYQAREWIETLEGDKSRS